MTEKQLQKLADDYLGRHKYVDARIVKKWLEDGIPIDVKNLGLYLGFTTYMKVRTYNKCKCGKAIYGWKHVAIPGMSGWPDRLIFFKVAPVALEFKVDDNVLSPQQVAIRNIFESQGYRWHTCYTWEEAKEVIDFNLHAEGKI